MAVVPFFPFPLFTFLSDYYFCHLFKSLKYFWPTFMRRLWKSSCVIKRRPNPRKVSREKYLLDDLGKSLKIRFRGHTFIGEFLKIRNVASTFRNGKKYLSFLLPWNVNKKQTYNYFCSLWSSAVDFIHIFSRRFFLWKCKMHTKVYL